MTDLEITKRCAENMGYTFSESLHAAKGPKEERDWRGGVRKRYVNYDPLVDRNQAMQLVEKFHLDIICRKNDYPNELDYPDELLWGVYYGESCAENDDLRRAICKCVAKIEISAK